MAWLTDNTYVQTQRESIFDSIASGASKLKPFRSIKFVHAFNPFQPTSSQQSSISEITFNTMRDAKHFARYYDIEVEFSAAIFEKESKWLPSITDRVSFLARDSNDVADFAQKEKLPLLFEIIDAATKDCQGNEWVIFTNTDICVVPNFYTSISKMIESGFTALTVNRRTIPTYGFDISMQQLMGTEIGTPHIGYDCFVFPIEDYRKYVKTSAIIGNGYVDRSLIYNMLSFSKTFCILKHTHHTYHLGDDKIWNTTERKKYRQFNRNEALKVYFEARSISEKNGRRIVAFGKHEKERFLLRAAKNSVI